MKKTSPGATNNLTGKQTASLPITGVVLCGGRATRMQGQDKGLLSYQGIPMVNYAIQAFAPCQQILINANRNHAIYHELTGLPVRADSIGGFACRSPVFTWRCNLPNTIGLSAVLVIAHTLIKPMF